MYMSVGEAMTTRIFKRLNIAIWADFEARASNEILSYADEPSMLHPQAIEDPEIYMNQYSAYPSTVFIALNGIPCIHRHNYKQRYYIEADSQS